MPFNVPVTILWILIISGTALVEFISIMKFNKRDNERIEKRRNEKNGRVN